MRFFFLILVLIVIACNEKKSPADQTLEINDSLFAPITDPYAEVNDPDSITREFLTLLNNYRIDRGLNPLIHHEGLKEIARKHGQDMAYKVVAFGHGGFSQRCSEGRISIGGGNLCAENVAMGQKSAQAVFNSWINSTGHKANIENARHSHTGFGYHKNASGTFYWTQIFLEKK